jgi:hypothetical protein
VKLKFNEKSPLAPLWERGVMQDAEKLPLCKGGREKDFGMPQRPNAFSERIYRSFKWITRRAR